MTTRPAAEVPLDRDEDTLDIVRLICADARMPTAHKLHRIALVLDLHAQVKANIGEHIALIKDDPRLNARQKLHHIQLVLALSHQAQT